MRRWSSIAALLVATGGIAWAQDPAMTALEHALPRGWSLLATDSELVIRHDRACFLVGDDAKDGGHLINLELRYRLEPKWTAKQLADAKAANDKLAGELAALRAKQQIDKIKVVKGKPAPATADERARLAAYEKGEAAMHTRMVRVPLCTLGESSLFDGDDTYAQLKLKVDPQAAIDQANSIVDIVKKHCTAN